MTDATQNVRTSVGTTPDEIKDTVRSLVARISERDPSEISDTTRFAEDLAIDSLMAIEIMVAANKLYKLHIGAEEFATLSNVQMAADCIQRHLAGSGPAAT